MTTPARQFMAPPIGIGYPSDTQHLLTTMVACGKEVAMHGAGHEYQLRMLHRTDPLWDLPFLEPDHAAHLQFKALVSAEYGQFMALGDIREPPLLSAPSLL